MNLLDKDILLKRSQFLQVVRQFFISRKFYEMDTPILKKTPSLEPFLNPFMVTSPDYLEHGYLITSPEFSLKQILTLGIERIFEISHTFRAGEMGSPIHSAEFLMLEFYFPGKNLNLLIEFVLDLFEYLNDHFIDFSFSRSKNYFFSIDELFQKKLKIEPTQENLEKIILEYHLTNENIKKMEFEDLFFLVFLNFIEPNLPNGIGFIYDYPKELSSYSKIENGKAKRVEVYWDRIELGNGFLELVDYSKLIKKLKEEQLLRKKLGKALLEIDENFTNSMRSGFPDCLGIAIGLDRLFLKILNLSSLKEVSPYAFTLKK